MEAMARDNFVPKFLQNSKIKIKQLNKRLIFELQKKNESHLRSGLQSKH